MSTAVAEGGDLRQAARAVVEEFGVDPDDFLAARQRGTSVGTRIVQRTAPLHEAGEVLNRSFPERSRSGEFTHVVSPVVIPKRGTSTFGALFLLALLVGLGLLGTLVTTLSGDALAYFGPHYWAVVAAVAAFLWWRRSLVMVPEGCQALITKFGKLVHVAGPGRVVLLNPWKRVSYIVNTTREYPFNAPISEAPTQQGVKASVDLFLQFRIEDPAEFIFVLGAVSGFQSKLENAISEVTRSLIYEQRAEDIYDLVGESTQPMLDSLNQQFLPAVRLTNVNITHAEPSSQDYRMNLAAPEMVRVAKEAYTYEYELRLRKEQNEGDLNKELATLRETLSAIDAEIAGYQAQMDTAYERETNRATAMARQRFVEAESTAKANAALLEAQALDLRAVSAAEAPEILEYRFEQDTLDRLEAVADSLPQVVHVGDGTGDQIDFLVLARRLVGVGETALFSDADLAAVHDRRGDIQARIGDRQAEIDDLLAADRRTQQIGTPGEAHVEEIRRSVTDESVERRIEESLDEAGDNGGERR
ncbi:MAG TPA: SPFH domain-containing protein [Cryptosporangiaceae bacterium]|nr:SPFH domain-containing protein [Cryptosporangiaceae bacterium]